MACLAAAGANLCESGVDFGRDALLRIQIEAKKASGRDNDRGDKAQQNFHHSVCSDAS